MLDYDGREQTKAKHAILGRYLEQLALITLSTFRSIDFIDAFAGPWESRDPELKDTSIGIALSVLQKVAEERNLRRSDVCCIFNEKDPEAYQRLTAFERVARERFPLVRMVTMQGKFEDNAHAIRAASNNTFRLLFVDPTGFTGFPPNAIELFKGRPTEVIINFMSSFIGRFVAQPREEQLKWLTGLVGPNRAREFVDRKVGIDDLLYAYMEMVKDTLGYEFAAASPIHYPDTDGINFYLVYGTNHPKGMKVMRETEYGALSEHEKERFNRKDANSPQIMMFPSAETHTGPYARKRMEHQARAASVLLDLARAAAGTEFAVLRARVQEQLYLRDQEIAAAAAELAERGKIDATWRLRGPRTRRPNDTDEIWPIGTNGVQDGV